MRKRSDLENKKLSFSDGLYDKDIIKSKFKPKIIDLRQSNTTDESYNIKAVKDRSGAQDNENQEEIYKYRHCSAIPCCR